MQSSTLNPYEPPSSDVDVAPTPSSVVPFTSVGAILRQSLSVYFDNLGGIAAITLVVFAPVELVKNYWLYVGHLEENFGVSMRVENLVETAAGSLVTPAILAALAHKLRTGRPLPLTSALRAGVARWASVFGVRLRAGILTLVGLLFLVVPGVQRFVSYSLADSIVSLENDTNGGRVLDRSTGLLVGHFWKMFAVIALAMLPPLVLQVLGGVVSAFAESWIVTTVVDCVGDVFFRFSLVPILLVYLSLANGEAEASG